MTVTRRTQASANTQQGTDDAGTASRVLDTAEWLAQTRGYHGFSYADIAAELGVTKASVHYHFATKADLGEALMGRYTRRFFAAVATLDDGRDAHGKLGGYAELYAGVLRGDRMCLCGMLAAEYDTLPEAMQRAVARFFAENEDWLTGVIGQGVREGTIASIGSPDDAARLVLSTLEGAMLVARTCGDPSRFDGVVNQLLGTLRPPRSR